MLNSFNHKYKESTYSFYRAVLFVAEAQILVPPSFQYVQFCEVQQSADFFLNVFGHAEFCGPLQEQPKPVANSGKDNSNGQ